MPIHTFQLGCLFCFVCFLEWDLPNCASSSCILGTVKKIYVRRGAQAWFRGVWTYGVKVIEFRSFYELSKLENYFDFDCGNGTRHISCIFVLCKILCITQEAICEIIVPKYIGRV